MSETKSLKEAHESLWKAIAEERWEDVDDAVRAGHLAVLEEALTPLTYGQHFETREALIRRMQGARRTMRRQIKELGT